jgi:hypothetical protein
MTVSFVRSSPAVIAPGWWANDANHTAHYQPATLMKKTSIARNIPQWAVHSDRVAHEIAVNGKLSGTVLNAGQPVENCLVRCYYRHTGDFVAQTWTNSAGGFTFINLTRDDMYYVAAFDDTGSLPNYNAQIYDMLLTVNM